MMELSTVRTLCNECRVGKRLPTALYVHRSALHAVPEALARLIKYCTDLEGTDQYTLIKSNLDRASLSLLLYSDFDEIAHPILASFVQVFYQEGRVSKRRFSGANPPLLHRKHTFLAPDHPRYEEFQQLTQAEKALGLLKESSKIGTLQAWEQRLKNCGIVIEGNNITKTSAVYMSESEAQLLIPLT